MIVCGGVGIVSGVVVVVVWSELEVGSWVGAGAVHKDEGVGAEAAHREEEVGIGAGAAHREEDVAVLLCVGVVAGGCRGCCDQKSSP